MKKNLLFSGMMFALLCLLGSCDNPTTGSSDEMDGKDAISVIMSRKSVRSYDKDRPIEDEKLDRMIRAGMAAPSGMDYRPWEILVVNDREILNKLADTLPYAKMLAASPVAIIVCGDTTKSSYWFLDCSAVTQNILLAAEAMGIGAVWTAAYPYQERMDPVIEYCNLPTHILPLAVIPMGYPDGETPAKDKYDASKIHYNKW